MSFTFFRFDAAGTMVVDIVEAERLVTMTGPNELTSVNKGVFKNVDGTVLRVTCATEVGKRF